VVQLPLQSEPTGGPLISLVPRPFFATEGKNGLVNTEQPNPFLFHTLECWWANQVALCNWCNT